MKELISIIVPIYNSARYICECVYSVLEQTYENFELILIDDGSLDESKDICLKLCETDKRIRFFTQEHRGVSAARNTGLKAAEGKYLFYMDSDDIIHPDLLKTLYNELVKTHSTMAVSQFSFIENKNYVKMMIPIDNEAKGLFTYLESSKALDYFIHAVYQEFLAIAGKMILRSAAQTFFFDESLSHGEDSKYIYQILVCGAADATILHWKGYYCRKHSGNISKMHSIAAYNSMYKCERYICDYEKECDRIHNAITREKIIISRILGWYIKSKHRHERILLVYLKKLALNERKLEIYSYIGMYRKVEFTLAFYCFPLYRTLCKKDYIPGNKN